MADTTHWTVFRLQESLLPEMTDLLTRDERSFEAPHGASRSFARIAFIAPLH